MGEKYQDISALDNIAIGNSALGNLSTVKNAAIASGAHEYIRSGVKSTAENFGHK